MKKTPLYDWHIDQGAKMVPFAGWSMPLSYSSQIEEHHRVRKSAGIFDVSHMGEIILEGEGALEFCDALLPNKIKSLQSGQTSYNPMCREDGTVVDDVYVYIIQPTQLLICVNASNVEKDFDYIKSVAKAQNFSGNILNHSDQYAQLAIQGPQATQLVESTFPNWELKSCKRFRFVLPENNLELLVSKTGYTGERGFEIYCPPDQARTIATTLMKTAQRESIDCLPAGLGCRDTLRLEAGFPLYGHELDDKHTAIESGLGRFCQFDQKEFIGKTSLEKQFKNTELCRESLIAFKSESRRAPRQGQTLINREGLEIGNVVSGAFSPTLGVGIGMGFMKQSPPPDEFIAKSGQGELLLHLAEIPFYTAAKA
jgi:aminomethyltransferase